MFSSVGVGEDVDMMMNPFILESTPEGDVEFSCFWQTERKHLWDDDRFFWGVWNQSVMSCYESLELQVSDWFGERTFWWVGRR